jgi:hypothetical protein
MERLRPRIEIDRRRAVLFRGNRAKVAFHLDKPAIEVTIRELVRRDYRRGDRHRLSQQTESRVADDRIGLLETDLSGDLHLIANLERRRDAGLDFDAAGRVLYVDRRSGKNDGSANRSQRRAERRQVQQRVDSSGVHGGRDVSRRLCCAPALQFRQVLSVAVGG